MNCRRDTFFVWCMLVGSLDVRGKSGSHREESCCPKYYPLSANQHPLPTIQTLPPGWSSTHREPPAAAGTSAARAVTTRRESVTHLSQVTSHKSAPSGATDCKAAQGPAARRRSSCAAFRTKRAPAKASEFNEMSPKHSRTLGTSSIHRRVTSRL